MGYSMRMFGWLCWLVVGTSIVQAAEKLDYAPADPELKVVLIDKSEKESFLSVRLDTLGRIFVGGREALFVYEPRPDGSYEPAKELLRFPKDSWIYDIAIRGHDLYLLTTTALYLVPDAVLKRTALEVKRLVWGVPMGHVHQCFHGLAWGPEGDLYISMGDPLWYYGDFNRPDHWGHWSFFCQPEGTRVPYNGVGGVFRIRPDGSEFKVVARGLRNSCGLVFDSQWNLFTNDNDHEGMPALYVPGRLLHIVPGAYYSWPRGWLRSKTPDRADLLDTLNENLGRFVPVGQSYYHDTFLPEKYRDNLLVARWCTRQVTRYPLKPHGASFKAEELPLLVGQNEARPVGVTVGRGGRIFVTISYMAQNEGSPVYRSDLAMITRQDDPPEAPFEAYDAVQASNEKVLDELELPSWSRKEHAFVELGRRRNDAFDAMQARMLRADTTIELSTYLMLLSLHTDKLLEWPKRDPSRSGDIIRWFHELGPAASLRLSGFLIGKNQATEFNSDRWATQNTSPAHLKSVNGVLIACRQHSEAITSSAASILAVDAVAHTDPLTRHLASLVLAERGAIGHFTSLLMSNDKASRLGGVLAIGFKLTIPPVHTEIPANLKLDPLREESAYKIHYYDKQVDLREHGRIGNFTVADHWKQGTHTPEQEQLFELLLAALADPDEQVRLQAAHFLSVLNDQRSEPLVAKVIAANEERRLVTIPLTNVLEAWLAGPFANEGKGFEKQHEPELGPLDLNQKFKPVSVSAANRVEKSIAWQAHKTKRKFELVPILGPLEDASVYAYFRVESATKNRAHFLFGSDDGIKVWHNGRLVWTNDTSRAALPYQDQVPIELQPGGNDFLVRVRNQSGDSGLYVSYRTLQPVTVTLPEQVATASLADRLASSKGGQPVPAEFLQVDWLAESQRGDAANGRKLFEAIGCAKCHAVTTEATVIGGPSLADAGKRFTIAHLVESIMLPSQQVSPVFRATQIVTSGGQQYIGLVTGETAEKVEILLQDAKRVSIAKADIEQREFQNLSPMPQGVVKKVEELRDLLAFLRKAES